MKIYGGLKPEDWRRWGQFTTFKENAPELLRRQLRKSQIIYCSPLVDPYQPAEETEQLMPGLLDVLIENPPAVFAFQTRGPLILRDVDKIVKLTTTRCAVRVSFSLTTNRDEVRRLYEPHCATFEERLNAISRLRERGIRTFATLAPLLPSDIEELTHAAISVTNEDLIGDPLHVRAVKRYGATTREAAFRISAHNDFSAWLDPERQAEIVREIERVASAAGRRFATGPEGFSWLAQTN